MLRKLIIIFFFCFVTAIVYFKLVIRGNNRVSVYHHHGIWLPSNVKSIKFTQYPDFPNLVDNHATTTFELDKTDYCDLLKEQQFNYLIRFDSTGLGMGKYVFSEFSKIPDSLIIKNSLAFRCKSNVGDIRVLCGDSLTPNTVLVKLDTDWD